MDVIPLNEKLVKGSHGATDVDPASGAVLHTKAEKVLDENLDLDGCVDATAVYDIILNTLRAGEACMLHLENIGVPIKTRLERVKEDRGVYLRI